MNFLKRHAIAVTCFVRVLLRMNYPVIWTDITPHAIDANRNFLSFRTIQDPPWQPL